GTGLFDDFADYLAAGADHFTDLVGRGFAGSAARSEFAHFRPGSVDGLGHLAEDEIATVAGLAQRDLHDLLGDAGDLDVHLQAGDAIGGTGHLEVHVAKVIFITEDVGQDSELLAFEDQAHGNAGDGLFHGNACIHQRERGAADSRHGRRSVGLGDFRNDTQGVGEFLGAGPDRIHGAPGQLAVPDLAASGRAHATGFTHLVGRKVIVQQEVLLVGAYERIDELFVIGRAQ